MIDPRGEGPGVLLPLIDRRAQLWEQLVAATIRQEQPEDMIARLFIPAHGADNPESNHVVTSIRERNRFVLITPGGAGGGYSRWRLFLGSQQFFSFAFQNQGETTDFPLPFVVDAGVDLFCQTATPGVSAGDFMHFYGWPE